MVCSPAHDAAVCVESGCAVQDCFPSGQPPVRVRHRDVIPGPGTVEGGPVQGSIPGPMPRSRDVHSLQRPEIEEFVQIRISSVETEIVACLENIILK